MPLRPRLSPALGRLRHGPAPTRRALGLGVFACLGLLGACATPPPPDHGLAGLLADEHFKPPAEAADASDLFTLSDAMHEFLRQQVQHAARRKGGAQALLDALNAGGRMRLDYDASRTRTAAQAFADGQGNCLSLLVMAAALARELKLQVGFYSAQVEENWVQDGPLLMASGHVNLGLGTPLATPRGLHHEMLIDFLPAEQLRRLVLKPIGRDTVEALYMNNRAVEALRAGQPDQAYAWARAALMRPGAPPQALNTLGVLYLRVGLLARAERVFAQLLQSQPERTALYRHALSNQVQVLQAQGRSDAAQPLRLRLARLDPDNSPMQRQQAKLERLHPAPEPGPH
jgi:tetratricopeptide (TPR) repeat protein